MKLKLLIGFTAAALALAHVAHADFTFYSGANTCENVPGNWSGSGKATNWLIGECVYNGAGTISALDMDGNFSIEVNSDKRSGSLVCPEHNTTKLKGVCVNGVVTIKTEYGNLNGIFQKIRAVRRGN